MAPLRRLAFAAAATPVLFAFPLFRLAVRLYAQVGLWRTAATLAVVLLPAFAATALAALLTRRVPARVLGTALVLVGAANLAASGLAIWFYSPRLAPAWALAGAFAAWALFAWVFCRQEPADRQPATILVLGLGAAFLAGLGLLLPGVAGAAWNERTLQPVGPQPLPAAAARPDRPHRIVLVTVDALRARSLDTRDEKRLPAFARLAREATSFENAHAISDATVISMPLVMSGAGVAELEAARRSWQGGAWGPAPSNMLREGMLRGLPEQLAPAGYRSYYATKLISPVELGLADEFAAGYAYAPISALDNSLNARAFVPLATIVQQLRARTSLAGDTPNATAEHLRRAAAYYEGPDPYAFLWVHLGGPHAPYREVTRLRDGSLAQAATPPVEFDDVARADAAGLARIESLYEREVEYLDQELGRFLARLRRDPRWASTLLVVTADHGEEFQPATTPHGSGRMSEDLTHIPLIVHAPGQATGRREAGLASNQDVTPTLMAASFGGPLPAFAGLPLGAPLPADRIVGAWGLYHRNRESGVGRAVAAYQGRFKYMRRFPGGVEALYDLNGNASEDVAARHPAEMATLRGYVDERFGSPR